MKIVADEIYISLICNGEFNAVPGFPIGELFESFFDNINYNVVKEKDDVYVDFTGDATCDDKPCTILIRFEVDITATDFEIVLAKVDDEVLSEHETVDLLEDIAYVGGAELSDEYYKNFCDGECHTCDHEECNCEDEEICTHEHCDCEEDLNCEHEHCDCNDEECDCEDSDEENK